MNELPITFYYVPEDSGGVIVSGLPQHKTIRATLSPMLRLWEGTGTYYLTGDGKAEIALVGMVGGKTLEAAVYRWKDGRLADIFHWSGWHFEIVHQGKKSVIAATPLEYGSLTELYIWDGDAFRQCNECFPEFFGPEILTQQNRITSDVGLPPRDYAQACQLGATALIYGKSYAKAEALCNRALDVVADSSRVIAGAANADPAQELQNEQAEAHERIMRVLQMIRSAKEAGKALLQ